MTKFNKLLWLMNGTAPSASRILLADPNWSISHLADLNDDGKADILWRNTNGAVVAWEMDGTTVTRYALLLAANPDWRITHAKNHDGYAAEVFLRHTNGAVVKWSVIGTVVIFNAVILGPDPDWRITHVGNFHGYSRYPDNLWRHTNGAVRIGGTNDFAFSTALFEADPDWRVSHTGDYNGDGKADILWRHAGDGSINMWLMNGATPLSMAGILGPGPWAVVP